MSAPCPMCHTPNGPIGKLGRMLHFNCRACGMWYGRAPGKKAGRNVPRGTIPTPNTPPASGGAQQPQPNRNRSA